MQHWVGPLARGRPGADPTAWGASVAQWRREARCPPGALPFTGLCPGETTQSHRVERPSPRLIIPGLIMPTSEMVVRTGEDRMFFPGQARPGRGASRGHCRPPPPQPGPQPWRRPSSQQLPCSSSPRGHFHIHEASGSLCPAQARRNLASLVTVGSRKTSLRSNGSWVPLARQQPGAQAKSF